MRSLRPGGRFIALSAMALSLAACGGSASSAPLVVDTYADQINCIPAPDPGAGVSQWNSPVGFSRGMFYNQGAAPLTIDSVTLLQPDNVTLRGAIVYKMPHSTYPIPLEWGWDGDKMYVPTADWNARQQVPGAVIPPQDGPLTVSQFETKQPDLYEIAVGISVKSPGGGRALGEVIKYQVGSRTYTYTFKVGMAIVDDPQTATSACAKQVTEIQAIFNSA